MEEHGSALGDSGDLGIPALYSPSTKGQLIPFIPGLTSTENRPDQKPPVNTNDGVQAEATPGLPV